MTPQSCIRVSTSLGNSGLCWTIFARNRDTAVSAEGNDDLQTPICVLVARCLTLSNHVSWQNWMAAYLGYTLRIKTLVRGWPVMARETHTRRRRRLHGCTHLNSNCAVCTCIMCIYVACMNAVCTVYRICVECIGAVHTCIFCCFFSFTLIHCLLQFFLLSPFLFLQFDLLDLLST